MNFFLFLLCKGNKKLRIGEMIPPIYLRIIYALHDDGSPFVAVFRTCQCKPEFLPRASSNGISSV